MRIQLRGLVVALALAVASVGLVASPTQAAPPVAAESAMARVTSE
jgi:hypothetical protein